MEALLGRFKAVRYVPAFSININQQRLYTEQILSASAFPLQSRCLFNLTHFCTFQSYYGFYNYDLLVIAMKTFFSFLDTQLDKYANINYYIDCRTDPQKLVKQLQSHSQAKKLAKYFASKTSNHYKIIRKLSIANLLIINSKSWFEFIQTYLANQLSKDEWINEKFLLPYFQFLVRCCISKDRYLQCVNLIVKKGQARDLLFYSINMLRMLFKVVQKMPLLGRYYKPNNSEVISSAVEIIALQAQKLYAGFKHSLQQILYRRQAYIKTKEDERIMKGILIDELTHINEEMKKLFLDKYFYPLGKGIGVKLFKPQQQTIQCQRTLKDITSNHLTTQRRRRHSQLEKTLFPAEGLVNHYFYEETLLSATLNSTLKPKLSQYKQLDDLAVEEQQGTK